MLSLLRMAAKNLLRHKRRTALTGAMIGVGTLAAVLAMAYGESSATSLTRAVVESFTGDIQIRAAGGGKIEVLQFDTDEAPPLAAADELRALIAREPGVKGIAPRCLFQALLADEEKSSSVEVAAVDPVLDRAVLPRQKIARGSYLTAEDGVLMSKGVAGALGAEVGREYVLLASGPDGYLNAVNLRVQGIVDVQGMEPFLGRTIYIHINAARRLLYLPDGSATVLVVALKPGVPANAVATGLRVNLAQAGHKVRVDRWQEIGGIFSGIVAINRLLPQAALAVVLLVVALGVVNTVLMSVLERTREIGTMMALGAKRREVLGLFLAEAGLLGLGAALLGGIAGSVIVLWLGRTGIPAVAEAMEFSYGGKRLYLLYDLTGFLAVLGGIAGMSVLAALLPARNAARLNPVEALRRK